MSNKKYLVISDAASMHVYNFIRLIVMGRGYDVYVIRHSVRRIPKEYMDFYEQNNIVIYSPGDETDKRSLSGTFKRFIKKSWFMLRLGRIDVCHIHYVNCASLLLYKLFRFSINCLILSYWGDDILIPSEQEIKMQRECLKYANAITVTVKKSLEVFVNHFGHQYDNILSVVHFPTGVLPLMQKIAKTRSRQECRKTWGIPENKVCIVCGYTSDCDQRQDECLYQIAKLSNELKKIIHVVVPMQYGTNIPQYIEKVYKEAKAMECSYQILRDYASFDRCAELYFATDIYIHVRKSDAFSNALKEQVYSGSKIIQGSWLIYRELDDMKLDTIKIKNLDELPNVLGKAISEVVDLDKINLFEPIRAMYSVDNVRNEWDEVINKITQ